MFKIIKNKIIQSKIRKNLANRPSVEPFDANHIHKIGCIVDMEQIEDARFLQQFIESYVVRFDNYVIVGYREKSTQTSQNGIPIFTEKDVQTTGRIANFHADRLLEFQYDILINYFNTEKLPLLLLSSAIKAKLRIGFEGIPEQYNDIILQSSPTQGTIFVQEIKKLIQTIR